ncbi:MAG: exonuclease domain-containing protein [Sarcina sp.]
MKFVSIDFETANEKRTSACAIGITYVENNKIIEKFQILIKPKDLIFKPMNIWIHGITEQDVINEEEFDLVWKKIKKYIENNLIIAHNAYFDIDVLIKTLELYNLNLKTCDYICTVELSKRVYEGLPDNKLCTLAELFDTEFRHHNAEDDSMIAALIFIDICKHYNIKSKADFISKINIIPGQIKNNLNMHPIKKYNNPITKKKVSLIDENLNLEISFFKEKTVVFTGPLKSMSRAKASTKVKLLGGIVKNTINKSTNILVTNLSLDSMFLTNKLKCAKNLLESGFDLLILSEDEFLNLLKTQN